MMTEVWKRVFWVSKVIKYWAVIGKWLPIIRQKLWEHHLLCFCFVFFVFPDTDYSARNSKSVSASIKILQYVCSDKSSFRIKLSSCFVQSYLLPCIPFVVTLRTEDKLRTPLIKTQTSWHKGRGNLQMNYFIRVCLVSSEGKPQWTTHDHLKRLKMRNNKGHFLTFYAHVHTQKVT